MPTPTTQHNLCNWKRGQPPADPVVRKQYPVVFLGEDGRPVFYVRDHAGIDATVRWLQLLPAIVATVVGFLDLEDGTTTVRERITGQDDFIETLRGLMAKGQGLRPKPEPEGK